MERFQRLRLIEAILFSSAEPVGREQIMRILPEDSDLDALLEELKGLYANRGITLVEVGDRWAFRTATDLASQLQIEKQVERKLSRAAIETLAIIAYHQPVTRGEIEEIRGVALSKGTLDNLLEAGWVKPKGRRRTPGRPVTWGTSDSFLDHFSLDSLDALPGLSDLKAAGLLDKRPAAAVLRGRGARLDEWSEAQDEEPEDDLEPGDQSEPWDLLAAEFEGETAAEVVRAVHEATDDDDPEDGFDPAGERETEEDERRLSGEA